MRPQFDQKLIITYLTHQRRLLPGLASTYALHLTLLRTKVCCSTRLPLTSKFGVECCLSDNVFSKYWASESPADLDNICRNCSRRKTRRRPSCCMWWAVAWRLLLPGLGRRPCSIAGSAVVVKGFWQPTRLGQWKMIWQVLAQCQSHSSPTYGSQPSLAWVSVANAHETVLLSTYNTHLPYPNRNTVFGQSILGRMLSRRAARLCRFVFLSSAECSMTLKQKAKDQAWSNLLSCRTLIKPLRGIIR